MIATWLAADPAAPDSLYGWVQAAGVVGVLVYVVFAFMTERLVPGSRLKDTCDRYEARLTVANDDLTAERAQSREFAERALPILTEATETLKDAARGYGTVLESVAKPSARADVQVTRLELVVDELRAQLDAAARALDASKGTGP